MRPVYRQGHDHGLPPEFWANVLRTPSCWLWVGTTTAAGYGQFRVARGTTGRRYAHRLITGADFTAGLVPDHLCSVPNCVNPADLELVTPAVNTARATAKRVRVTHCPCGLAYTAESAYWHGGYATCKTCAKRRSQERHRG